MIIPDKIRIGGQDISIVNEERLDENELGTISAKCVNDQDCYGTCSEEGDDYTIYEILPDGTRKTWCKYEHDEDVEGYLPNMPTHFMLIPKTSDGFA